jgi:hypothetical protein
MTWNINILERRDDSKNNDALRSTFSSQKKYWYFLNTLFHLSIQTSSLWTQKKILKDTKYFLRQIGVSFSQFLSLCNVLLMAVPNNRCQAASRLPKIWLSHNGVSGDSGLLGYWILRWLIVNALSDVSKKPSSFFKVSHPRCVCKQI